MLGNQIALRACNHCLRFREIDGRQFRCTWWQRTFFFFDGGAMRRCYGFRYDLGQDDSAVLAGPEFSDDWIPSSDGGKSKLITRVLQEKSQAAGGVSRTAALITSGAKSTFRHSGIETLGGSGPVVSAVCGGTR